MTGAPIPEGADAVLPAEEGREGEGRVEARGAVTPGRHVGLVGEDVRTGAVVLRAGRWLRPQDLGVAASVGRGHLAVRARPAIGLVVTGDELLPPGAPPTGCRIVDANSPMLGALLLRDGADLADVRRVPDGRATVEAAIEGVPGDAVLVSGGSSVGQEDHAPRLVAEKGLLAWHGVGLRPASPAGAGLLGGRPVFLLPGNPVSCLSAYDFFAGRWVRRAAGRGPDWPYRAVEGVLAAKVTSELGRVDYVRVRLEGDRVVPLMARGASILTSTTEADGFLVVPAASEGHPEGGRVTVWRYGLPMWWGGAWHRSG
jgi:molybdopterin molybdotransferase